MNVFLKKTISFIMVVIISAGIFLPAGAIGANGAVPVEIGYSLSSESVSAGGSVDVNFFFKNFAETNIECSAFQLDVYVDPAIFTPESMKCTLDGTGAMFSYTKFNSGENKIKTIYFNTASSLPKESTNICTFTLRLNRNFEKATDVQLNVTLVMVLDIDNTRYDVEYSSPVVKCVPLSGSTAEVVPPITPSSTNTVIETIAPENTVAPIVTTAPESDAPVSDKPVEKEYTITYLAPSSGVITTEKVKEGHAAKNSKIPYRPGYDFVGWSVTSGSLKNVTSDMVVTATYKVSDILYTISVEGGTVNGTSSSTKVKYDDCVVVKIDETNVPAGKYFAGWKKNGSDKVVSLNKTYSFLATGSDKVTAVYSDSQITGVPQTVLFDNLINADGVVFTSENYIPEGYSYSGSGVIVTKSATIGNSAENFVLNGVETSTYRADKNSLNAQFSIVSYNLNDVFYVRSYLIYKNSAGEKVTVYSDIGMYDPVIF